MKSLPLVLFFFFQKNFATIITFFRKLFIQIEKMTFRQYVLSVSLFLSHYLAEAQKFPGSLEVPPSGYSGKIFQLSQDYPSSIQVDSIQPWMKIDFKKEPLRYVEAVYQYILEGNIECDWVVQNNKIRKWYHVPWMHWNDPKEGQLGREFINGLTRERDSRQYELSPLQPDFKQNWAIGMYNSAGGFIIGEVWKDPNKPAVDKARFPYGTVSGKLLFTETDTNAAPYLKGSPVWLANIHTGVNEKAKKSIRPVQLLQFDIAVRDPRADNETGWVFGTLVYDGNSPASDPWRRFVPAGAIWGNDVNYTSQDQSNGKLLKESYVNPIVLHKFKFGWAGRLNGPVDNPQSSCISCHSTADFPMLSSQSPNDNASIAERLHWFNRNIKSGESFTSGTVSLDYSMQLAKGIERFYLFQNLSITEGKSGVWKDRFYRYLDGGYLYIAAITIILFLLIMKFSQQKFIMQPFLSMDLILLLLRFGIGIMFMVHGFGKITGGPVNWVKLGQFMANMGIYFYPAWWGFLAAFAEFAGGFMMITGLFFRPALLMMFIHISIACLKHYKGGDTIESASHAIEMWFVFLCLLMSGPGKFSLDSKLFSKSKVELKIK